VNIPPLSQSRQSKLACPLSYVETEIRGHKQASSEAARRGSALHKFLSEYVQYLVKAKKESDTDKAAELMVGMKPDAAELVGRLVDDFKINPDAVYGTELWIGLNAQFELTGKREASEFEMTLDLVELPEPTKAKLVDYKSQFHAVDADTFQGRLYSLGLMMLNPHIEQVEFELRFVRWGKSKRSVKFTRADIPKLQAEARQWRQMQLNIHNEPLVYGKEVIAGQHCTYCPLLIAGCPLENENPAKDPNAALLRVLYHRLAAKANEETVRAHCDANGPLRAKDGIGNEYEAAWTVSEQKKFSMDVLPVIQSWDKAHKSDPVLPRLSISGLGTLLKAKKRSDLSDECANHCEVKTRPKFHIGRAGEPDDENGAE
jgi:hypothetical protein